jgi:uncharacterized protein with PQ loop repeat
MPHGSHDVDRAGRGILRDDLVLSAAQEVLGSGSAGDLSLKMFATLAAGVALWAVYGFLKSDIVIILANAVSLALLFGILYFKLKERPAPA